MQGRRGEKQRVDVGKEQGNLSRREKLHAERNQILIQWIRRLSREISADWIKSNSLLLSRSRTQ